MTKEGVRSRHLVLVGFVVGAVAVVVLRLLAASGAALPPPGWPPLLVLLFLAMGVYFAGLPVKRLRSGRPSPRVGPLRAARTLVLAQAAALTGAALVGWYAAQALLVLPDLDVASQRWQLVKLVALLVASVLLTGSGLLVQRMCRLDEDQHEPPEDEDAD